MIDIQNKPKGKDWRASEMQVTPPVKSGNWYKFQIESNDADFNDLILTCYCYPPNTGTDFIVHGRARYYNWQCLANPCLTSVLGIESIAGLQRAAEIGVLRKALLTVDPERVSRLLRNPASDEARRSFKPVHIPLTAAAQNVSRQAIAMRLETTSIEVEVEPNKKEKLRFDTPREARIVNLATDTPYIGLDKPTRVEIGRLKDRLRMDCQVHALPNTASLPPTLPSPLR